MCELSTHWLGLLGDLGLEARGPAGRPTLFWRIRRLSEPTRSKGLYCKAILE